MLASDFKVEKKEAMEYTTLPEDVYQVELLDIKSEVKPTYDTRNKPDEEKEFETVFNFQFVLLDGIEEGKSLRGRNLFANFVPTYLYISGKKGKNSLYKITEALLGHELTLKEEAEIDGEFLNSLIGKQMRVGTIITVKGEKTYSNIDKYLKANTLINSLTDEEKETATIKEKERAEIKGFEENSQAPVATSGGIDYPADEIDPNDIPF